MIHLSDRSHIPASPARIWNWFSDLEAHYLEWHPEHVAFQSMRGTPVEEGSVCSFETRIGQFRLRMRSRVVEAVPCRYLQHESLFPGSLINAGGSFTIEPVAGGSDLIAEVWMGCDRAVLGPCLDRMLERIVPISALRRHMAEEGRNLARLMNESI